MPNPPQTKHLNYRLRTWLVSSLFSSVV